MLKKRTFFLMGGLLLIIIVALVVRVFYLYNKPHKNAQGEPAVATLSAEALYKQYQDDETKANKNYLGKVVEVTGTLSQVMHSGSNEIWILSAASQGGINCQMFFDKNDTPKDPKPGDKIVLKGKCTGFLMDVNLTDCVAEK